MGISTNLERRVRQHNGLLKGGSRATRILGSGWELVHNTEYNYTRSEALKFERKVKQCRGVESRVRHIKDVVGLNSLQ